jgi:hypothetical protein
MVGFMDMENILEQVKANKNVPERCYNTALSSDEIFRSIAKVRGMGIEKTSFEEDMYDHIDYYLTYKGIRFPIDIKSSKRTLTFSGDSKDLMEEWVWIELKNVAGRLGWLYGKAVYIAYIFNNSMWLINRQKLVDFIAKRVTKTFVSKEEAGYKLYQRRDRKDVLTLVKLGDIMEDIQPVIVKI